MNILNHFLGGCIFLAILVASLFFLKFWRQTRDRLFLYFAIAFALLGVERLLIEFAAGGEEALSYVYVMRLAAFCLIIVGIITKNRR